MLLNNSMFYITEIITQGSKKKEKKTPRFRRIFYASLEH